MGLEDESALVTGGVAGHRSRRALVLPVRRKRRAASRNKQKLDEMAQQMRLPAESCSFVMDVAEEEQMKSGMKSARATGKIEILVNNAGITRDQLAMRMKRATGDVVLNTNLTSAYLCNER